MIILPLIKKIMWAVRLVISDYDNSALTLREAGQKMRAVRDAAEHRTNKMSAAIHMIYDRQLSANSLLIDIVLTLRALEFRNIVLDKDRYTLTILQHLVVLIAAFDENINPHYYGKEVQVAIGTIDSIVGPESSAKEKIQRTLKEYNRHVDPYRPTLKFVRNRIGAHRDADELEIKRAIQKLGEDWIISTPNHIFNLITSFGYIAGQAVSDLGEHLKDQANLHNADNG